MARERALIGAELEWAEVQTVGKGAGERYPDTMSISIALDTSSPRCKERSAAGNPVGFYSRAGHSQARQPTAGQRSARKGRAFS